jgi:hypothetical protein
MLLMELRVKDLIIGKQLPEFPAVSRRDLSTAKSFELAIIRPRLV